MHCVVITVQQKVYPQWGNQSLPIAGGVDQPTDVQLIEGVSTVVHFKWLKVKPLVDYDFRISVCF